MLTTLAEAFASIAGQKKALAAFNVFGFEDAQAVAEAAESLGEPVALMANRPALAHMPTEIMAAILREVGRRARVPVVVHLDHAVEFDAVQRALAAGFTSVMFDGSQLPFEENVARTREVVRAAHALGVSVEAEIGSVGYADGTAAKAERTSPDMAASFEQAAGPDALAISVGTVHRMTSATAVPDFALMDRIVARMRTPAVIHGSSGVGEADLRRLVEHGARKINIGTALRMEFGRVLRQGMADNPAEFDRIKLFGPCMRAVRELARAKMIALNGGA